MSVAVVKIQPVAASDLEQVNRIVGACVMSWDLPDRVKRLAIPSYRYQAHDLEFLELYAAFDEQNQMVGVAALEQGESSACAVATSGLTLHGLYVDPAQQKKGIGQTLLDFSLQRAGQARVPGLLVKAQSDANSYFAKQGFEQLPSLNPDRDYPHRWWKPSPRARDVRSPA